MIPHVDDSKNYEETCAKDIETEAKHVKWYHQLLLNRHLKVVTTGLLLSVLAPMLVYHYVFTQNLDRAPPDGYSTGSCSISRAARLPCGNGSSIDTECNSQCCFDYELNVCFHRFPSRFTYIANQWNENTTLTPRIETVPFNRQPSLDIQLSIDEISPTHLSLTFYDPEQIIVKGRRISAKNYTYEVLTPEIRIIVNDTNSNTIFDTVRGPIIASKNVWEIAFRTTEENMYGLGEIPLVEGTVKVLYNYDGGSNVIPLIFSRTNDTYHGLLLDIVEPTEVKVAGENQVVVRSITNRGLKIHLFSGPEPKDIMQDVTNFIGFKSKLEYWMLGAHVCSELSSVTAYDDLSEFITKSGEENIPYDSHCGVSDVTFHNNCKENHLTQNLVKGMELLRSHKKRFMPHISPYIFYNQPINTTDNSTDIEPRHYLNCTDLLPEFDELMYQEADSKKLYLGLVNNETVIYPNYGDATERFITALWDGPEVDGVILQNTWPADETLKQHNETHNILPYFNEHFEKAFNHTPQWNITSGNGEMYVYTHNTYGNRFADALRTSFNKPTPVYTAAQWMAGEIVHKQNVDTSWTNLQRELNEAALGGISGNWLWMSPVCGDTKHFNLTTQTHLCVKWYKAATFLPLIKIHSKHTRRDPLAFSGTNKANILKGLELRYSLLPYFYTTLQKGPLLRPMFYQFPFSIKIANLRTQFSVGEDLLVVPNLQPGQSHVHVYMPPGRWFEFWSGLSLEAYEGEPITMTTTDADFLILLRAGAIIVLQKDVKETAEDTRLNSDFSITVALDCKGSNTTENQECIAKGDLYINDNMTIYFEANHEQLKIKSIGENLKMICDEQEALWARNIKDIHIFGLLETENNYDYSKNIQTNVDLCQLETVKEIVVKWV